jgi:hypothetical protein
MAERLAVPLEIERVKEAGVHDAPIAPQWR